MMLRVVVIVAWQRQNEKRRLMDVVKLAR